MNASAHVESKINIKRNFETSTKRFKAIDIFAL